jgi:hypothetical protein
MTIDGLARVLQRAAVRTGRGPLRPVWAAVHRAVIWAVAWWVTLGARGSRTYLKGSFGLGRPVFGLSDVDMIVVVDDDPGRPGIERERVERRWQALARRWEAVSDLFQLWVYEGADLPSPETATYLDFGLSRPGVENVGRPAFLGPGAPHDPLGLLERPGPFGSRGDWRRLGARRRAPLPIGDGGARAIFAWLEVRYLWGYAFLTVADPARDSAAYMCQKLVADSAATWLWLRFGERISDRRESLIRALHHMPEEEPALTGAIELGRRLPRRPEPPLATVLPFLVRTCSKIAEHITAMTAQAAATEVKLVWGGPDDLLLSDDANARADAAGAVGGRAALLPLADWRALAIPALLDNALAIVPGDPSDPDRLAELTHAGDDCFFPALRGEQLIVLPTTEIWHRGRLRRVACATSDPVSIALADGEELAAFPDLGGWSAQDCARRAVAEHRGWLSQGLDGDRSELPFWVRKSGCPELSELCGLLTAARAALFADSLLVGAPELALTARAIVDRLSARGAAARAAAAGAYEALEACRGSLRKPDPRPVGALREVVRALPAYASHLSQGAAIR